MNRSKKQQPRGGPVRMTLFVVEGEANSRRAKQNLARFCEEELNGNYELEVVDVLQNFQAAVDHHVMVTPTLMVTQPPPAVAVLGDLRETDRLRTALGLQ